MAYGVNSESYIVRARKRLDEGTLEGLFYAAFELRCGVEARLHEYLEAYKRSIRGQKGKWRIPELVGDLEKAIEAGEFPSGDRIVRLDVSANEERDIRATFYYTPVTSKLCAMAGKSGNLMHHPQMFRENENVWWDETRTFLEEMYLELKKACRGNLMGLPFLNTKDRKASFLLVFEGGDIEDKMKTIGEIGERLLISTYYVTDMP